MQESNKNLFLSIIVPIYNTEPYLCECLDSLLSQNTSFNDYEIICIDDGASIECCRILESYSQKYSNVHIIHQTNNGVSSARNRGIEHATGEYVWFVDSDDLLLTNILPDIRQHLMNCSPDELVVQPIAFHDGIDTRLLTVSNSQPDSSTDRYIISLWSRLIRRDLIIKNSIFFDEKMAYCEDLVFLEMLKPYINSSVLYNRVVYFYRIRENSASTSPTKQKIEKLIQNQVAFKLHINYDVFDTMFLSIYCGYMTMIMNYVAKLPKKEELLFLKRLKSLGLFPMKKEKCFKPEKPTGHLSLENRILLRLKNQSYTLTGYYKLRFFRIVLRAKRRMIKAR